VNHYPNPIDVTLEGHTECVWEVIQLKDGRLASSSNDHSVRIWNISTMNCEAVLNGHGHWVRGLCQLEDGRLLSGSWDSSIRIWNLETNTCEKEIKLQIGSTILQIKQISTCEILCAMNISSVHLININSGVCEQALRENGIGDTILNLALLKEGGFVTAANSGTLRIWQ